MNEHDFRQNLQAYIDNEMPAGKRAEMDAFIATNPLYRLEVDRELDFSRLLRTYLIRQDAPYAVRESVIDRLGGGTNSLKTFLTGLNAWFRPVAVGFLVVAFMTSVLLSRSNAFPVFSESVNRHLECLKGVYAMEIRSANPQEVARWFGGKLDFSVQLPLFKNSEVELIGARLCHLKDRKAAFLTYEYHGRRISVFMIDSQDLKFPAARKIGDSAGATYVKSDRGYQSILCLNKKAGDIARVYVSDIAEEDLLAMLR